MALGRALTARIAFATASFALAAALSAAVALIAVHILARRPWTARFAAALFLLLAGTGGLATFLMTLERVLTYHRLPEIPLKFVVVILGVAGAGTLYNVLSIAAPIMLPFALPLTLLLALLIARRPR